MKNYTLIIAEKPDAANRIANALDVYGKAKKIVKNGVPYYKAYRNGDLVVVPALGHLFTVAAKSKADQGYPVFDYHWVPIHLVEGKASRIKVWLNVINELAEDASAFIDACDFDVEGSIIGYCILKNACAGNEKIAQRMKYSSLTTEELQESFSHLSPHLDFALIEAGLTRHELDWLYGINLTRALTLALKNSGRQYSTLSTGRVQGPTLSFLQEREKAIKSFVAKLYWIITAKICIDNKIYLAEYERILASEQEATAIVESCKTIECKIDSITVDEFAIKPPFPFDLGALQSEAFRVFKYPPMRTSNIAQHLYVNALISYPRTSSQKLPPTIGYQTILKKLSKSAKYTQLVTELLSKQSLRPHEGEKTDPAHPAIYPTGNIPEKPLATPESKILDLITRRFIGVFADDAIRENKKVTINLNRNIFYLKGARTINYGWLRFYPFFYLRDLVLPSFVKDQKVNVKKVALKSDYTKPLARYNPRSLLLKMEKEEIGTKATRATIIQTLLNRKYVSGTNSLNVSGLGRQVVEILTEFCPTIVSPEMTREIEKKMDEIQQGKQTKEVILKEAIDRLKPILSNLKANEPIIGERLGKELQRIRQEQATVGSCPKCGNGKLMILHSKKNRKRFIGCSNYFQHSCNLTLPLPQTGIIKPRGRVCETCGYPIVHVWMKAKRSWKFCINPNCPSKRSSKTEMQD